MTDNISPQTAEVKLPAAINDSDIRDVAAERQEELSRSIANKLYEPLYEFSGCLGTDGSFRRYTKRVEARK